MKHLLTMLCLIPYAAFSQTFVDMNVFSTRPDSWFRDEDLKIDSDGNILVGGALDLAAGLSFQSCMIDNYELGTTGTKELGFLVKLNSELDVQWAKPYRSVYDQCVYGIAVNGDNQIVAGLASHNIVVGGDTINLSGDMIEVLDGMGVSTSLIGNYGGSEIGMESYPNGNFLFRTGASLHRMTDPSTVAWDFPSPLNTSGDTHGLGQCLDTLNNAYVVGRFGTSSMMINGVSLQGNEGYESAFVYKCDPNGNLVWLRGFESPTDCYAYVVDIDLSSGDIYVGGFFWDWIIDHQNDTIHAVGGYDIFIARLSSDGTLMKLITGGGSIEAELLIERDKIEAIAIGQNGGVYISANFLGGTCTLNGIVVPGQFLARLDSDLNLVWVKAIASADRTHLQCDNTNDLILSHVIGDNNNESNLYELDNLTAELPFEHTGLLVARLRDDGTLTNLYGKVYVDINLNEILDITDQPVGGIPVSSGTATYTSNTGQYMFDFLPNTHTITITPPLYYTAVPPSITVTTVVGMGMLSGQDFRLVPTGPITDVQVHINSTGPPIPGFDNSYHVLATNIGTLPASGTLAVTLPAEFTYLSATPAPSQVNGNVLEWAIESLPIMQHLNFAVQVNLPASTPLGIEVSLAANATTTAQDHTPADNIATHTNTVVGSYDPNDKQALPMGDLSEVQIAEGIAYTIRFQNTGTWPAQNVRLLDTISPLLDVSTIRTIGSSHAQVMAHREGVVVEWLFPNINLPDSSVGMASQGFVTFHIMPTEGTGLGSTITNQAAIYFDFNAPIITNEIVQSVVVGIAEPTPAHALMCYPNPTNQAVRVDFGTANAQPTSITFIDIMGRTLLQKHGAFASGVTFDVSTLPSGIYTVVGHVQTSEIARGRLMIVR